jgi:hypothetical protein
MKNALRGQLGPRGLIVWFVCVIIAAGMMSGLTGTLGSLLGNLTPGSPEYFVWSIWPFLFVVVLAAAFIYGNTPQRPEVYQ